MRSLLLAFFLSSVWISAAQAGAIEIDGPLSKGTTVRIGSASGTIISVDAHGIHIKVPKSEFDSKKHADPETINLLEFYEKSDWVDGEVLLFIPHEDLRQGAPGLGPGTRIRVTVPGKDRAYDRYDKHRTRRQEGTLLARTEDQLIIRPKDSPGDTLKVSTSLILRTEVVSGRRGHTLKGALIGLGIGAVLGVVAAAVETNSCQGEYLCGFSYIALPPAAAAGGLVIGGIVGTTIRTDRWVEVSPDRLNVGLSSPPSRSATLALTLRF